MINLDQLLGIGNSILAQNVSMIGAPRMKNILESILSILIDGVPGDFVETGVWRGGACIFMRSILKQLGIQGRKVFVCDSFEGLPENEIENDIKNKDKIDRVRANYNNLAVSLEEVQRNFQTFDVLDDDVEFVKGWFCDTLPHLNTNEIALLRLDGDMYSSTMDALNNLYHKVSKGGLIIIDDYNCNIWPQCKEAVYDFRSKHSIDDTIHLIDNEAIYWQKS